ncbi:hypothetical protein GEMRC1_008437 [Eukaryota sp. GEM-RC1]
MGVKAFWSLIDSTAEGLSLSHFAHSVFIIDASFWLVQLDSINTSKEKTLYILISRLLKLMHYDIHPVFVFDGPSSRLKSDTLKLRRKRRHLSLHKLEIMLRHQLKFPRHQIYFHVLILQTNLNSFQLNNFSNKLSSVTDFGVSSPPVKQKKTSFEIPISTDPITEDDVLDFLKSPLSEREEFSFNQDVPSSSVDDVMSSAVDQHPPFHSSPTTSSTPVASPSQSDDVEVEVDDSSPSDSCFEKNIEVTSKPHFNIEVESDNVEKQDSLFQSDCQVVDVDKVDQVTDERVVKSVENESDQELEVEYKDGLSEVDFIEFIEEEEEFLEENKEEEKKELPKVLHQSLISSYFKRTPETSKDFSGLREVDFDLASTSEILSHLCKKFGFLKVNAVADAEAECVNIENILNSMENFNRRVYVISDDSDSFFSAARMSFEWTLPMKVVLLIILIEF